MSISPASETAQRGSTDRIIGRPRYKQNFTAGTWNAQDGGKPPATLRRTFQADVRVLQGGVPNGMAWYVAAQDRARWRGLVANTTWGRGDEAAAAAGHGGGDGGGNAG